MKILTRKLLSYLLIALLALAPLQPVSASTEMSAPGSMASCHTTMLQDGHLDHGPASSMTCDQCDNFQLCDENCCTAGICGTASMAIIPRLFLSFKNSSTIHSIQNANGELPRFSNGPYRPPRT